MAAPSGHSSKVEQQPSKLTIRVRLLLPAPFILRDDVKHKHHIIPRHMGGSDDPSNIIELTPEEHAEAHRKLYEIYGRWQDYLAWQGLAKLASKSELVKLLLSEAGKIGAKHSNYKRKGKIGAKHKRKGLKRGKINVDRKGDKNPSAKTYTIIYPDGKKEIVKALKTWCENQNLNYKTFHKCCIERGRSHKGYYAFRGRVF